MPVNISGSTGINTPGLDSAGMPTSGGDPIVESGSNSDGEWTRWADGTQICRVNTPNINDSVYLSALYPVSFIGQPINNIQLSRGNVAPEDSVSAFAVEGVLSNIQARYRVFWVSGAGFGVQARITATGRWK